MRLLKSLVPPVVGMFLLMGSSAAGGWAQGAAPAASPAPLPPLVAAYGAAWSSHDPEQVASLYVDDARFEEVVAGGAVTSNRAEFTGYLTELFAAFPDFALSPTGGFAAGDEIGLEWTVTGTYRGQFGTLPPGAGQRIALRGASMLQIDAGKIWSDREYWDAATLLAQVGALPGPGAATPATS